MHRNAFEALTSCWALLVDRAWRHRLRNNQVWVVKTDSDNKYAKLRTIEVTPDHHPLLTIDSCKLEWVYQPDGSTTFP
ncbi:MAG: hypothetical protein MZV63_48240 [Marinilabiliales bacterium]|nr:hypothetical protein [Marinilabiliales bacterium]